MVTWHVTPEQLFGILVPERGAWTMGRWSKDKAKDEEAIGESLALAITINENAKAIYVDTEDPRLLVIAKKSKEIYGYLHAVLMRSFTEQRDMFEPTRSLGPDHNPQMREE